MNLRALVVEDEAEARRALRSLIDSVEWLEFSGEATNGPDAVRALDRMQPDLVFLDIRLPGLSGIEVLEAARHPAAVVFTTAHDEYAVRAFELGALDYLLKPFGRRRFIEAIGRVRGRLGLALPRSSAARAREFLDARAPLQRVFVHQGGKIVPLRMERVQRIEAKDDYVLFISDGAEFLSQIGLGELAELLDPQRFLRVHRSHIINLDFVAHVRPFDARRYLVVMKDGSEVISSREGSRSLRQAIL